MIPAEVLDDDRLARAALCRAGERMPAHARRLLVTGRAAAALACTTAELAVDPRRDLDRADAVGARFVVPGDDEWPPALADLRRLPAPPFDPPGLWVRGPARLDELALRAVAVVGSRAATAYGIHVAGEFAAGLCDGGRAVLSGGAYGVDGAAHRGALAAGGLTAAVLAGGVDVLYPRGHAALLERVSAEGLLVSESPPGAASMRQRFLRRNRLIAALSEATVLVEAGWRSGALNTVAHARHLGRLLLAVPGPITSALSTGCHRLIREDGLLVGRVEELLEAVGPLGRHAEEVQGPSGPRDGLAADALAVLDAVPARRAVDPASVARTAGVPVSVALRVLGPLCAAGLVEVTADGYRLTALGRQPSARPLDATVSGRTSPPPPGTPA